MGIGSWLKRKSEAQSVKNIRDGLFAVIRAAMIADPRLVEAQRKFLHDLTIYNSIPLDRVVREIIVPELLLGQDSPSFPAAVTATFSVVQRAALATKTDIRPHTPDPILEIVDAAWAAAGVNTLQPFG